MDEKIYLGKRELNSDKEDLGDPAVHKQIKKPTPTHPNESKIPESDQVGCNKEIKESLKTLRLLATNKISFSNHSRYGLFNSIVTLRDPHTSKNQLYSTILVLCTPLIIAEREAKVGSN